LLTFFSYFWFFLPAIHVWWLYWLVGLVNHLSYHQNE